MFAFSIVWLTLAAVVVFLATWRKFTARQDDEYIHIHDSDAPLIARQARVAHRLDVIDQWGKKLTVIAGVYGVILLLAFMYIGWQNSNQYLK